MAEAEAGFVIERGEERRFLCKRDDMWFWKVDEDEAFQFPNEGAAQHARMLLLGQFCDMTVRQFEAA
jgi:hypothetical protein